MPHRRRTRRRAYGSGRKSFTINVVHHKRRASYYRKGRKRSSYASYRGRGAALRNKLHALGIKIGSHNASLLSSAAIDQGTKITDAVLKQLNTIAQINQTKHFNKKGEPIRPTFTKKDVLSVEGLANIKSKSLKRKLDETVAKVITEHNKRSINMTARRQAKGQTVYPHPNFQTGFFSALKQTVTKPFPSKSITSKWNKTRQPITAEKKEAQRARGRALAAKRWAGHVKKGSAMVGVQPGGGVVVAPVVSHAGGVQVVPSQQQVATAIATSGVSAEGFKLATELQGKSSQEIFNEFANEFEKRKSSLNREFNENYEKLLTKAQERGYSSEKQIETERKLVNYYNEMLNAHDQQLTKLHQEVQTLLF